MDEGSRRDSHVAKRESSQKTPPFDLEWGKFLALSPTPDPCFVREGKSETILPYQKHFIELQGFLKQCDEPDQEYLKTLGSLSAVARGEHAVELESRAIMLSLEEAKEIKCMIMLNVFAKESGEQGCRRSRYNYTGCSVACHSLYKGTYCVQTIMCLLSGDSEQDLAFHIVGV